jgi:hypothetical protein
MTDATVLQREVADLALGAVATPADTDVPVDVLFTDPSGSIRRVPAFAGAGTWRVRYSSSAIGGHRYRVESTLSLAEPEGTVTVDAQTAAGNALAGHGAIRVAADQRHLEHEDGTPFLWLADSWWNHLMARVTDEQFTQLAAKRVGQGFSVVQLCAGLYPDPAPFDPSGASRTGWAWHEGFTAPNLAWYDEVDTRIRALVEHGLVPCITGSWGYYLKWLSVDQMLRHWRELVARWGAYPVIWCVAGEPALLYYDEIGQAVGELAMAGEELEAMAPGEFSEVRNLFDKLGLTARVNQQMADWFQIATRIRELDPFGRLVTIQNIGPGAHFELEDWNVLDFFRPSTGHEGYYSLEPSVNAILRAREEVPPKPVLVGEVDYEQILGSSGPEMQRFLFWSHLLSGAAGHSYGAQGLFCCNTHEFPDGIVGKWGDVLIPEAEDLPGATHLGLGRQLLLELPWEHFEPHPEWVDPHHEEGDRLLPFAAGLPEGPRVVYFPVCGLVRNYALRLRVVRLLELGTSPWTAQFVDPRTGERHEPFTVTPDADGVVVLSRGISPLPSRGDWVLLLQPA